MGAGSFGGSQVIPFGFRVVMGRVGGSSNTTKTTFRWADVVGLDWLSGPHSTITIRFRGSDSIYILDHDYAFYETLQQEWGHHS